MDEYPNMRCSNDDALAGAIACLCAGIFVLIFAYVHIKYKSLRILPYNDLPLKVIQVAKDNTSRRNSASSSKISERYFSYIYIYFTHIVHSNMSSI